jgi:hypothetical protein
MEIGYMIRNARKGEVDPERTGLLEKAWEVAAFVFH